MGAVGRAARVEAMAVDGIWNALISDTVREAMITEIKTQIYVHLTIAGSVVIIWSTGIAHGLDRNSSF